MSNHVLNNMMTSRIKADRGGYFGGFVLRVHEERGKKKHQNAALSHGRCGAVRPNRIVLISLNCHPYELKNTNNEHSASFRKSIVSGLKKKKGQVLSTSAPLNVRLVYFYIFHQQILHLP